VILNLLALMAALATLALPIWLVLGWLAISTWSYLQTFVCVLAVFAVARIVSLACVR
jgi:hypothetical protein